MNFWPLNSCYKRSNWKTWLAETFSEVLTSKLCNKKKYVLPKLTEMEQNWLNSSSAPYGFIKNLQQSHLRDSHVKFTGKNMVGNTTWAKLRGLIGQKTAKQFSVDSRRSFSGCYFSGKSFIFHFGPMFNPIQDGPFWGCSQVGGGGEEQKGPHP